MFNQFTHLVSNASGWAYAVVFLLALLDAILPVVPSETAVITAGVLAAAGHLSLPLIVTFAAVGALAGDNIAYFIGWRFGDAVASRFFGGEKGRKRIAWAGCQLREPASGGLDDPASPPACASSASVPHRRVLSSRRMLAIRRFSAYGITNVSQSNVIQ